MIIKEKVEKILIIKLRGIGDVVLSTIVLDNLRADFPDAKIDYLTDSPSKPGLEGLEQINSVIVFPKKLSGRIGLFYAIRKAGYDLILDLFSNPTTAQLSALSGARYKAGFPYQGRKWAYNLYGPSERDRYHSAVLHIEFLKSIGLTYNRNSLYYYISNSDISFVNSWLDSNRLSHKSYFVVSPSGGWPSKKCQPEKFAEIANAVQKKYSLPVLTIWGPEDFQDASKIFELINGSKFLAPATTIRQMASFIANGLFMIANDSGPMHISTAVGTPVLSLHGPTNPYHQGPYGDKHEWINLSELDCITCNLLECPRNHECFRDLPLNRVLEKVENLVNKNKLLVLN